MQDYFRYRLFHPLGFLYGTLDFFSVYIVNLCRYLVCSLFALLINGFYTLIACVVVLILGFIRNVNIIGFSS